MEYKELFHPKFKQDLKKIDKLVVKEIKDTHLDIILKNPYIANPLKGKLSNIRSYHFRKNRVEYRIAYEVLEDNRVIFYYMVVVRENFYSKLDTRVK